MTARPAPTECHCIKHTAARKRETWRATGWAAVVMACIYLPAYIAYYALGVQP